MDVHFIDTSVFTNILNVDGRNESRTDVMKELHALLNHRERNVLILPYATIIETGNHIAHIPNGSLARKRAEKFCETMIKTIHNEAPWSYYGEQMQPDDIQRMCEKFPDMAMRGEGFGDLSIIQAYNRYKEETPAIHYIRIWSLDMHMAGQYEEIMETTGTRN